MDRRGRQVVAVWRTLWLVPSETFVRDHVENLTRWEPLKLGLYYEEAGMGVQPDRAPFSRKGAGRRMAGVASRVGYFGVFDTLIRQSRPALVHAHFGTGAVEVLPIASRHRLPLVVTFHGHDVNRAPVDDQRGRYLRRLRAVFEYADTLLPVSEFIRGRLLALGAPAEKITVHHLGIPVREPLPDPGGARSGITFVGRLTAQKGVADLLSAYARLPADLRRRTPVTIVGEGPQRHTLESIARAIPDGNIAFLGTQPSQAVARLLARSAVFVGPSKAVLEGDAEAFGLSFIEASLAGVPVVSYAYAGVPEAVVAGETGLLVPVGDVGALAKSLQTVLTDDALARRIGRAGQQRVVREFDVRQRSLALERLYDDVAVRGRHRVDSHAEGRP